MLTLNLREKRGSGVKNNLTIIFSDPENLYGHNRSSLSITPLSKSDTPLPTLMVVVLEIDVKLVA